MTIDRRTPGQAAIVLAVALIGIVPPDGLPRAVAYVVVHGAAALALLLSSDRDDLPDHQPWRLIIVGFWFLVLSDIFWLIETQEGPSWTSTSSSLATVLASINFGFGGVLLIGGRPSPHLLHRAVDATIIIVAGAVIAWQWWLLSSSATTTMAIGQYPFVVLLVGASAALVVLTGTLWRGRDPDLRSILLMGAAGSLTMGGQTVSLLLGSADHLPRAVDPMWFVASVLAVFALRDPSAAIQFRAHRARSQMATPLKLIGLGLAAIINPSLIWLQDASGSPLAVAGLGTIVSALTLAGVWRASKLISDRDEMRNALELSERRFRSLAEHANDLTLVVRADKLITYAGPSSRTVLGCEPRAIENTDLTMIAALPDRSMLASFIEVVASAPSGSDAATEIRLVDLHGRYRDAEIVAVNLLDNPAVSGIVVTAHDVTDLRGFEARLAHQASHDALTGLANRHYFAEQVQEMVDRTKGHRDRPSTLDEVMTGVLFIDIDDFKTVNDSLGHDAGDRLLQAIAQRLTQATGQFGIAARLGGDEFAVLLRDASQPDQVHCFVTQLLNTLCAPVRLDERTVAVTASIGVALSDNDPAEVIMRNADTAMFIAKAEGKHAYRVFEHEMHVVARKRLDLKADLPTALASSELTLFYQPIVRLADRATVGVEALVRWNHPTLGLVGPNDFIPLAEESGAIGPIGSFVLRQACHEAEQFHVVHNSVTPPYVSINLSPHQLLTPRLVEEFRDILVTGSIGPQHIIVEITERVLLDENPTVRRSLAQLRDLGIKVALDDFGTGYSSLSYLNRLDVDIVKLDRSFTSSMATSGRNRTLIRGIVDLTRSLNIITIAEGVERAEQVEDLQALGCDFVQGYYFGRPAPAAAIVDRLRHVDQPDQAGQVESAA